jgi:adenylosuccinate synthase
MTTGKNTVVLGLQWGDEGKGKVIDCLSGTVDVVVRCQGGANAGHTVVVNGTKTILHLLPSGALHPGARCVIGNGVVVDPLQIRTELQELQGQGVDLRPRLRVSDRAHLVLPWHKALDAASEQARGQNKVGTTLRGIGPCYAAKITRTGLRCGILKQPQLLEAAVWEQIQQVNSQLALFGAPVLEEQAILDEILPACAELAPLVGDAADELQQAVADGKCIMFEGAQGIMLDIDHGTYPFVTSSNTGVGGVVTGSGVSHKALHRVIGILKAYTTRVGAGPFPCELTDARGDSLREQGGEFGATTGRPRRCGWLDLVVAGHSCRLNGVDGLALTKLDVLSGEVELQVCTAYELDGQQLRTVPSLIEDLSRVTPVYQRLPGWQQDISACRRFEDLPPEAQEYVRFIEAQTGVPVRYIGVGPDREQTIVR